MDKFKVGTRVHFVNDGKVCEGVIDMVLDYSDSLIIKTDDAKYKRRFDEIVIIEEKPEEPVKSAEPKKDVKIKVKEKSEITITREEFTRKGAELCTEMFFRKGPKEALRLGELVAELAVVLFVDIET